jgi:hypothetical protein
MISSYKVMKPMMNGKIPSGRGGITACYADNKLVVFGGHFYVGDGKFEYSDETWLLDIKNCKWHKMTCSGQLPAPRYGHSACIIGSRMFIFGGRGENGALYKDVVFLDLIEWFWIPVSALADGPCGRLLHASEAVGRKIVIHGGWNGNEIFNDMWIFNTDSFTWMQPKTSGFGPTPRFGHSLNLTGDGRLLMFGGCTISKDTGNPIYNGDVRELDTDSMIWTRTTVHGTAPTPRYGHSAVLVRDSMLLICGGWGTLGVQSHECINNPDAFTIHVLDTTTMTWSVPNCMGSKTLKHTYNHAACIADNTMYIYGGYDGRQASSEFFEVELNVFDIIR